MFKKIFSVIIASCAIIVSSASLQGQETQADSALNNTGTDVSGDSEVITKSKRPGDTIIITGRRYESSVLKEGKSVTVITEEEIKASGKDSVSDMLEAVPGITVSREGTDGGLSFIFMRGAEGGNVLVMIDGVKISDPSSTDGRFDLSLIKTDSIERIEIVRGSMSSLYGSDASGGVINIITKKGRGKSLALKFTGGSYDSFSQSVSVSESGERSSFYFSGSHYTSGGISIIKDTTGAGNFDEDKTEYYTASCKMTGEFWDKTSMMFSMNYSDKKMDVDRWTGIDGPDDIATNRLFTSSGIFRHNPLKWWSYQADVSLMSIDRSHINPDAVETDRSISTFQSSGLHGGLINKFTIPVIGIISAGAEIVNERINTSSSFYDWSVPGTVISYIPEKSASTMSLYIHDAFSLMDMLFINGGLRMDNHNAFGNHYTWDVSGAFIVPVIRTKLRASAGSAFKAPSLYQLYDSQYGNIDLDPERSYIYDAGIGQEILFAENVISFEGTYFYQKYIDKIDMEYPAPYKNTDGETKIQGFEFASSIKISDLLNLNYMYTYTDFIRNSSGQHFLKRPENKHIASMNVTPGYGLGINLSYTYIGSRWGTQTIKLDPYHKVDANIRYAFNEMLTLTARGENLTDADYMDTYGFNTYGRSFFGGVELTF